MAMPCRTHRSRLLLLLLLLLSPGLGGWAVQVVHPCSTDASQGPAVGHGGNDRSSHPAPARGSQGAECHCFGTCNAGPTFQPATAPTFAAPIPSFALTVRRPAEPERPVARRLTLLQPPATAPPVLS